MIHVLGLIGLVASFFICFTFIFCTIYDMICSNDNTNSIIKPGDRDFIMELTFSIFGCILTPISLILQFVAGFFILKCSIAVSLFIFTALILYIFYYALDDLILILRKPKNWHYYDKKTSVFFVIIILASFIGNIFAIMGMFQ